MKIWFLTNAPSPYQMNFISAVHNSPDADVDIRLMRSGYDGGAWKPSELPPHSIVMKALAPESCRDEFRFHAQALKEIRSSQHDLYVLSGLYSSPTFIACARLLKAKNLAWCVWLERPWPEDFTPSWSTRLTSQYNFIRGVRRKILKSIASTAPMIMCVGSMAMDAYEKHGANRENLVNMPYICNTEKFENVDKKSIESLKTELGINHNTVFLYCGSLIKRKGVDVLISAFQRLAEEEKDSVLILVGDGEERETLKKCIKPEIKERIMFLGHVGQEKLPQYYLASDVFVFPSRYDGWGVVVNEACAAGLPVITTETTGASCDLVKNGHNGFVLPADDENALYEKMIHFINKPDDIQKFGDASLEMIQPLTVSEGVERFIQAAKLNYEKRKDK